MTDDLIERLESSGPSEAMFHYADQRAEAAARIRQQAARIEALEDALASIAYRSVADDDLQWCQRIARDALKQEE